MRTSSQYYKKANPLPEEYSAILDKYPQGTILVAFGTTWQPTFSQIEGLLAATKKLPNTGFIFSLKDAWDTAHLVDEAKLPNV